MEKLNLNQLFIETDGAPESLIDFSISVQNPNFDHIEVIFKNLQNRLIEIIKEYKNGAIFGSVAWFTSFPILKALSACNNVQIIVQKEDFLRPDINQKKQQKNWKKKLQENYNNLKCELERHQFREPIKLLSTHADPIIDPIRCVGKNNADKKSASPRAHHKFLVFCKFDNKGNYLPTALWTGSFNFTKNSTYSMENALYLTDSSGNNPIISAFLKEHHQIFTLSEKLDWKNDWVTPEFRIGT